MENKFNEKDKEVFITFLNYIAKNAEFGNMKTEDIITYFKLLNHVQTQILPKIDANILEIIDVIENKDNEE